MKKRFGIIAIMFVASLLTACGGHQQTASHDSSTVKANKRIAPIAPQVLLFQAVRLVSIRVN